MIYSMLVNSDKVMDISECPNYEQFRQTEEYLKCGVNLGNIISPCLINGNMLLDRIVVSYYSTANVLLTALLINSLEGNNYFLYNYFKEFNDNFNVNISNSLFESLIGLSNELDTDLSNLDKVIYKYKSQLVECRKILNNYIPMERTVKLNDNCLTPKEYFFGKIITVPRDLTPINLFNRYCVGMFPVKYHSCSDKIPTESEIDLLNKQLYSVSKLKFSENPYLPFKGTNIYIKSIVLCESIIKLLERC